MGRLKRPQEDYFVVQSNKLSRSIRLDMRRQEQRVYYFLASLIKGDDDPETTYSFKMDKLRIFLGMSDSGTNYEDLKNILKYHRDHSQWIKNEDGDLEVVSVLSEVRYTEETKDVKIKFHRLIAPYLFNLFQDYTQARLEVLDTFNNKYAAELYMYLVSFFNECRQKHLERVVSVDDLKYRLYADDYKRWPDFKRFVLDKCVEEINSFSDCMRIEYEPIKTGNRTDSVKFIMDPITDKEAFMNLQFRKMERKRRMEHKKGRPKRVNTAEKDLIPEPTQKDLLSYLDDDLPY